MRRALMQYLTPVLNLQTFEECDGQVLEGILSDNAGTWFPVTRGVPCFLRGALRPDFSDFEVRHGLTASLKVHRTEPASDQAITTSSFSDKWRRDGGAFGMQESHQAFHRRWYCKKLGLASVADLQAFYRDKKLILEVGPGSGFNSRFMAENTSGHVIAADISEGAHATFQNTRDLPNCHVVQADVMDLPFPDSTFDFVIADGILHHTPNTRRALEALFKKVRPGGQMFFYVYRRMGPARVFCDDHIRAHFTKMSPDDCYEACKGLTELGHALSKLNANITLDKPIHVLGIPAGTHDVQRLIYYSFVKCFWNDAFDYDTNNLVNFDWYHPHNAWQHTEEEVESWLKALPVQEYSFQPANPNGISTLLRKAA